ncbi:MAG: hypothetical protein QXZ31_03635 [Thermofilaceae archaeon]
MALVQGVAQARGPRNRVRIDPNLWGALSSVLGKTFGTKQSPKYWPYSNFYIQMMDVIGRVAPGVELSKEALIVRDPETGEAVAEIPWSGSEAVVNSAYGVTQSDIEEFLRLLFNAVYTFVNELYERAVNNNVGYFKSELEEDLKKMVHGRPMLDAEVRDLARRVFEVYGLSGVAVYRVTVPPELARPPSTDKPISMKTTVNGVEVELLLVKGANLHITVKNPFRFHAVVHVLPESSDTVTVFTRLVGSSEPPGIVPSSEVLEQLVFNWGQIALRAVEEQLARLQGLGRAAKQEVEVLEYWRTLLARGKWSKL